MNSDPYQLVNFIDEMEGKISTLQGQVAEEVVKMDKYRVRHLYVDVVTYSSCGVKPPTHGHPPSTLNLGFP